MVEVVVSIGSNCGDRRTNIEKAITWLKSQLIEPVCSDIYETPCALKRGASYLNAVVKGFYQGVGYDLDDILKMKEHEMGRTAECREKGEVPVDMDIVMENHEVVKEWDFKQKFFRMGYQQICNK